MDALTTYLPSRYLAIVFTLVGDSTTTSPRLATTLSSLARLSPPSAAPRAVGPTRSARERSARWPYARRPDPPERSTARCPALRPRSARPASTLRHSPAPGAPPRCPSSVRRQPRDATIPATH